MFTPPITDKAGRGVLCSRIDQLVREITKVAPGGIHEDAHELKRLLKRLDNERTKFHKLYGYTPPAPEESHAQAT